MIPFPGKGGNAAAPGVQGRGDRHPLPHTQPLPLLPNRILGHKWVDCGWRRNWLDFQRVVVSGSDPDGHQGPAVTLKVLTGINLYLH